MSMHLLLRTQLTKKLHPSSEAEVTVKKNNKENAESW